MRSKQRVVVLGGGYAGALAAIRVAGRARARVDVTLVDPKAEFVQRLRLHQVAAGQAVAAPRYDKLLKRKATFVQGAAERIDADRGVVEVTAGRTRLELPFDQLLYSVGSSVDMTAVPGVSEHAHSVSDVTAARRLSHALHYSGADRVVAVVGGGMTGIEVASEIATTYPDLRVKLVVSGTAGGWLSERARDYLGRALRGQGVELLEQLRVQRVEPERLIFTDGSELPIGISVWCGGFRASPLAARSGLETDHQGRLLVDRTLRSTAHPAIFAAGDTAATPPFVAGAALRMCCQVAGPTGAHAADNIVRALKGREPKPLRFGYIHQPISLGRRDGLIQFVDRGDRPRNSVLTGRPAALYKEMISSGPIPSMRMERVMPGATAWPFKEPKAARTLELTAAAGG